MSHDNTTDLNTPLESGECLTGTLADAVRAELAGAAPEPIGDHGVVFRIPTGTELRTLDEREWSDLPGHIERSQQFADVPSLVEYVSWYRDDLTTRCYSKVSDVGLGVDHVLVRVVLDDHTRDGQPNHEDHRALLMLRPSTAASRWSRALNSPPLSQEEFCDLIADGIGQIAEPAGATLRDLVSNVHAISSSEVTSVVRSGGNGQIVTADNVQLTGGHGNKVEFPESMTVFLHPFLLQPLVKMAFTVRIKPAVDGKTIRFALTSPDIDEALADAALALAAEAGEQLDLPVMFQ